MAEAAQTIVADDATTTTATEGDVETTAVVETTTGTQPAKTATEALQQEKQQDDDWRARIAGDDKTLAGYLARVPSEKALAELVKKHNDDIKAGKYIKPLPDNPTDAEVAAYRKQLGVPEKPEAYLEGLDGLVIGDDDKPIVGDFAEAMHGLNAPPAIVKAGIEWYYAQLDIQAAAEAQRAAEAKDTGTEVLREEWGADYKRTLNAVTGFIGTLPQGVAEAFQQGRDAAGLPLGSNPEVIKWLASVALEQNPLLTVVPGAGANQASAIADEIKALEQRMTTDRAAYFKDEKAQARYIELIEARDKLAEKG